MYVWELHPYVQCGHVRCKSHMVFHISSIYMNHAVTVWCLETIINNTIYGYTNIHYSNENAKINKQHSYTQLGLGGGQEVIF